MKNENIKNSIQGSISNRLNPFIKGEVKLVVFICTFGVITSVLSLVVPIAVQSLVNSVAFGSLTQQLIVLTMTVFVVLSFSGILQALQFYTSEKLQRRLFVRVVADLAKRIPQISARGIRGVTGAELLNPFIEISTLQKSLANILIGGLGVILQITFGILLLSFYHPYLLAFALILSFAIAIIVFIFGRNGVKTADKECSAKYDSLTWLEDMADMSILFRSDESSHFGEKRALNLANKWLLARSSHFKILFVQHVGAYFTHALASATLLGLGGYLVIKGQLTLGQLVAAELVVNSSLSGLVKLCKHLDSLYDLTASLGKLNKLRSYNSEQVQGSNPSWDSARAALIEIKNLSVGQESSSKALLKNINLTIKPKEKIAIFGGNGSGKTVLAESIFRLIKPDYGEIIVDGYNVEDIDTRSLRSRVKLVTKPKFFHGTLEENLTYDSKLVSRKDLRNILRQLGLENTIRHLNDGLETVITPTCKFFSYGEMLRIALARAIISNPGLLIIDQTFDGVDSDSQEKLLNILLADEFPCSILAFTHDMQIARFFDKSYFLKEGQLSLIDTAGDI